ncbi:MAG: hypothetical protein CMF23_01300 [Ignavibacteriae bacterium]|nr:hypothetical protein [Ignavibacteriota bacterium]
MKNKWLLLLLIISAMFAFTFQGCYSVSYQDVIVKDTVTVPKTYVWKDSLAGYKQASSSVLSSLKKVGIINSYYQNTDLLLNAENELMNKFCECYDSGNKDFPFVLVKPNSLKEKLNGGSPIYPGYNAAFASIKNDQIDHVLSFDFVGRSTENVRLNIHNTTTGEVVFSHVYKETSNSEIIKDLEKTLSEKQIPEYVKADEPVPVEWESKIKTKTEKQKIENEYFPWWAATVTSSIIVVLGALVFTN